jgi:predicted lipoprotein with Yx(FWY)xxD motif
MGNLTNQLGYVTNTFFSGGEIVTPITGTEFAWQNRGYGGLYVGTLGTLVAKTINGNVITIVSASGFIPGLFGAVSSSSTAANIVGFDPIPVALPTTTTSTSTSTTTAAGPTLYTFQVGDGTGSGTNACNNAKAGIFVTAYADAATLAVGVNVYRNAGGTIPWGFGKALTQGVGFNKYSFFDSANPATIQSDFGPCT